MSGYYSDSHVHGPETDTPPVLGSDLFVKKKILRIFVKFEFRRNFFAEIVSQNFGVEIFCECSIYVAQS